MSKLKNIWEGWSNYVKGETSNKAKERASICKNCEFSKVGTFERLLPDYELEEVQGMKCIKCTCPLLAKLRSDDEKCPIGLW
jgi:hypothetical protein